MRKVASVVLVLVLLIPLVGCGSNPDMITYTVKEMKLTLPSESVKTENHSASGVGGFFTENTTIMVDRTDKSLYEDDVPLFNYAKAVQLANISFIPSSVQEEDGVVFFEYNYQDNRRYTICVFVSFLESEEAFWMLQFLAQEDEYADMLETYKEWTRNVTFT